MYWPERRFWVVDVWFRRPLASAWVVVGLLAVVRLVLAAWSGWSTHQGVTELRYMAAALDRGHETYGAYVMRYELVRLSLEVFGVSEGAARLPSVVAYVMAAGMAMLVGGRIGGRNGAAWCGVVFATSPWVYVWGGRAMPEIWLVFGLLAALAGASWADRKPWMAFLFPLGLFVAVASKPVGVLTLVAFVAVRRWSAIFWILLWGIVSLVVVNWVVSEETIMGWGKDWWVMSWTKFEGRGMAREAWNQWAEVLVMGYILGAGFAVALGWWCREWRLMVVVVVWWLYALWDTPEANHGYYVVPAVAVLALAAGLVWMSRPRWGIVALVATVAGVLPFVLLMTGDLGDRRFDEVAHQIPDGSKVYVEASYRSIVGWYNPSLVLVGDQEKAGFGAGLSVPESCELVYRSRDGWDAVMVPLLVWRCG